MSSGVEDFATCEAGDCCVEDCVSGSEFGSVADFSDGGESGRDYDYDCGCDCDRDCDLEASCMVT